MLEMTTVMFIGCNMTGIYIYKKVRWKQTDSIKNNQNHEVSIQSIHRGSKSNP